MIAAYFCICKLKKTLQSQVYTIVWDFRNIFMVLEKEVGKVIKFLDTVGFICNNDEEVAKVLFFYFSQIYIVF